MSGFASQVRDWVNQTKQGLKTTVEESIRQTVEDMQLEVSSGGNMPVVTGFLQNSMQISLEGPLPMTKENPGVPVSYSPNFTPIKAMPLGGKLWVSYTATYAADVHYGAGGRPGRQWIGLAVQRWPSVVAEKGRVHMSGRSGSSGENI